MIKFEYVIIYLYLNIIFVVTAWVQGTTEGQQPAGTDVFQVLLAAQKSYTHLPKVLIECVLLFLIQ